MQRLAWSERLVHAGRFFGLSSMAVVFGNELQLSEMLLHTIMGNDKIRVITSTGQYAIKSLQAHSSTLDIFCQDELGRYFNVAPILFM